MILVPNVVGFVLNVLKGLKNRTLGMTSVNHVRKVYRTKNVCDVFGIVGYTCMTNPVLNISNCLWLLYRLV